MNTLPSLQMSVIIRIINSHAINFHFRPEVLTFSAADAIHILWAVVREVLDEVENRLATPSLQCEWRWLKSSGRKEGERGKRTLSDAPRYRLFSTVEEPEAGWP